GEGRRQRVHAVGGAVGSEAVRIVAPRPALAGRIVRAQLLALTLQAGIQRVPACMPQARLVHAGWEEKLDAHGAGDVWGRSGKWSIIPALPRAPFTPSRARSMAVSTVPTEPSATSTTAGTATVPHWIGGRTVAGRGVRLPVYNPATGRVMREV